MSGEGSPHLQRTMWAAVAASLAGDEIGLSTLLDDLPADELLVLAGAMVEVIAALLAHGQDRDSFLAAIRAELARTAGDG